MPITTPEVMEAPIVNEKRKLFDNFNQRINSELIQNPIYIPNQNNNLNNNSKNFNNNLNRFTDSNSNINNIENKNINNNFIQLRNYDNSYHRSQYFSNSNDNLINRKNQDLEQKYASYRKPEYFHTNYKTISKFPSDDNLNEVFDDPVFLEGKLEDQNRLKYKVKLYYILFIKQRFRSLTGLIK